MVNYQAVEKLGTGVLTFSSPTQAHAQKYLNLILKYPEDWVIEEL